LDVEHKATNSIFRRNSAIGKPNDKIMRRKRFASLCTLCGLAIDSQHVDPIIVDPAAVHADCPPPPPLDRGDRCNTRSDQSI
jgi:hypothetical protein